MTVVDRLKALLEAERAGVETLSRLEPYRKSQLDGAVSINEDV